MHAQHPKETRSVGRSVGRSAQSGGVAHHLTRLSVNHGRFRRGRRKRRRRKIGIRGSATAGPCAPGGGLPAAPPRATQGPSRRDRRPFEDGSTGCCYCIVPVLYCNTISNMNPVTNINTTSIGLILTFNNIHPIRLRVEPHNIYTIVLL